MAVIYMSLKGSLTSGGPTVAAARLASGFASRGHNVIYDKPNRADVCLCIIESGKVLRQVDRKKTRVCVRLDGAYFKNYWHSKTPDRQWRSDMDSLHAAIKRDVGLADCMVYQSEFSKRMIDAEIAERKSNFAIIHNGIDTKLFSPKKRKDDFINLFHHGVIRNAYIMEALLSIYKNVSLNNKVRLVIVGSLDAECRKIYEQNKSDTNIRYLGPIQNSKLSTVFELADIGIYPRQGSSCDNAVIEALSSGVPVVLPKFSGNSELISDGVHGCAVESNNWDYGDSYYKRCSDGVVKILGDLDNFKKNARLHAEKELNIGKMISSYLKAMGI